MRKHAGMKATAVLLSAAMLVACGGGQGSTAGTTAAGSETTAAGSETTAIPDSGSSTTAAAEAAGFFNEEGYPIVNEPFTLTIGYTADAGQGDWSTMDWWQRLAEESGITIEFVEYADGNAVSLMYASRDYPDIAIHAGSDKQIADAAEAGDVYNLEEYLDYAPNWKEYLDANPLVKASITFPDGHIHSLPAIQDRILYEMRDMWMINGKWLDELGLEVPTTIDEFYEVLKAIKANAGKGSIPENVIPYYVRGITNNIGGALDLINTYGIRVMAESSFATIDDNGKVEFNYANPDIKEPMEFIHKLVDEGLISKDGFTDDRPQAQAKRSSTKEPIVACYSEYAGGGNGEVALMPLDSGNGKTPVFRAQTSTLMRNRYTVFKTCEHPEIAMRFANMIAEEDWTVYNFFGEFDTYVDKNDDGTYFVKDRSDLGQLFNYSPQNWAPELMTRELSERIIYAEGHVDYGRNEAANQYSEWMIPKKNLYPTFVYSDEKRDRISELAGDITPYISSTLSSWALEGGIEEGWDAYIAQLNSLGLEEYLDLLQQEYDRFLSNAQ